MSGCGAAIGNPYWFPPLSDYLLFKRCYTCKVKPGVLCNAPRMIARFRKNAEISKEFLDLSYEEYTRARVCACSHAVRMDRGLEHCWRDIELAPRIEDREPGYTYGTL